MSKIGSATNKKIIELFNMMKEGTLEVKPDFQRKLVWSNSHKEKFIETILKGLPFPEIYFADGKIDLNTQKSVTLVVDGQQRLSTIYQYIQNDEELLLKELNRFPDLSDEQKTELYDYNVVVRDLGRISNETIKDIFNRINSVQYALNAMEVNNALYDGEFISAGKEILDNIELKFGVFNKVSSSRMKDLEFILSIMATIEEGGYFRRFELLAGYIKHNNEEYPGKAEIVAIISNICNTLYECDLKKDSIWLKKTALFTLIVELAWYLKKRPEYVLEPILLKTTLEDLEFEIYAKKDDISENEYSEFYKFLHQATAEKKSRIARGTLLQKHLELMH